MPRPTTLVAPILAACLVATGCSGSGTNGGSGALASGGTFTMAIPADLGTFDPYRNNTVYYASLAYDSLVNLGQDGTFVSGLAEKWSADARSASFTLRDGVTCSDGTPLTATRVAEALRYIGDPQKKSRQYGLTTPTAPFTVTADDAARTVGVTMTAEPFGFLLNTIGQAPIMCPKGVADPSLLKSGSDGTGPFVLTEVVPGQSYTFTVRQGYTWGPGGASTSAPGTPAKVVLRIIPNEATSANLLLSGEVNLAPIGGQDQQRLTAQNLERFQVAGSGAGLRFNQIGGRPTADKRVRQALVHALDMAKVVEVSTGGAGTASTGLVALQPKPCTGDTVAGRLPGHDVATAESLLDQAGWVKGADGIRAKDGKRLSVGLHYVPSLFPLDKPTAELLSRQWKAIGVDVRLVVNSTVDVPKVLYETTDWDVFMGLGTAYLPSQMAPFVSGPFPPKGTNLAGVNRDYDALVAKAKALTPPAACTYWNQAEQALYRDVNLAPISNRPTFYYLKNARAAGAGYTIPIPTSIRLLS